MKIQILYEDNEILLVNKPAGFPVHATLDPLRANVQGILEHERQCKLVLHHRLDLDTTGVLVFGKDPAYNKQLTDMFRDREVEKTYWAVVDGRWLEEWNLVETYILKIRGRWSNIPKNRGGQFARTRFELKASSASKSWLECKPETGRTHQIRLHCLEKSHPILGDRTYGRVEKAGYPMALHAHSLSFKHPKTGERLEVVAPAPDYWQDYYLKGL